MSRNSPTTVLQFCSKLSSTSRTQLYTKYTARNLLPGRAVKMLRLSTLDAQFMYSLAGEGIETKLCLIAKLLPQTTKGAHCRSLAALQVRDAKHFARSSARPGSREESCLLSALQAAPWSTSLASSTGLETCGSPGKESTREAGAPGISCWALADGACRRRTSSGSIDGSSE